MIQSVPISSGLTLSRANGGSAYRVAPYEPSKPPPTAALHDAGGRTRALVSVTSAPGAGSYSGFAPTDDVVHEDLAA